MAHQKFNHTRIIILEEEITKNTPRYFFNFNDAIVTEKTNIYIQDPKDPWKSNAKLREIQYKTLLGYYESGLDLVFASEYIEPDVFVPKEALERFITSINLHNAYTVCEKYLHEISTGILNVKYKTGQVEALTATLKEFVETSGWRYLG